MFKAHIKHAVGIFLAVSTAASADSLPAGWTLADDGDGDGVLTKGTSYVQIFDKVELDGLNSTDYMKGIEESTHRPGDVIVDIQAIKSGKYVVQLTRLIERDGVAARSVLMLCKGGQFKDHLLEIYTERTKTIDLIAAGKYAIGICAS